MTDQPTPGQIAYTAYMAVLALSFPMDFAALPDTYHRAWDAAAQAVLLLPVTPALPAPQWYEDWACRLTEAGHVEVVCPLCGWTCLLKDAGFGWMERHWAEEHAHG